MVLGLSNLEMKVGFALSNVMYGYGMTGVQSRMQAIERLFSLCREKYDWMDRKAFLQAYNFFRAGVAFHLVLTDTDPDAKTQKIRKYLKKEFLKRFKLDALQFDEIFYNIEMVIRAFTSDDEDFPKNYMPANAFWNIYDSFTDRTHQSPSKVGLEVGFSNITINYRAITLENVDLSKEFALLYLESLMDAESAVRWLR